MSPYNCKLCSVYSNVLVMTEHHQQEYSCLKYIPILINPTEHTEINQITLFNFSTCH